LILWRISNYADLSGTGGVLHRGRWHNRGRPVVYLAESAAGALLEVLVHIEASHPRELPRDYQLLEVDVPDAAQVLEAELPPGEGWRKDLTLTRRAGDGWLASASSLLLRVPSSVVGRTFNFLMNPAHEQARACSVVSVARYPFDERLLVSVPVREA
jgi:RES domain-containing protein